MAKAASYVPYTGPIVTRADAKKAGQSRYFTGRPCPKGHICERWVASYSCAECQRLELLARYRTNTNGRRDRNLRSALEFRTANLDFVRKMARLRSRQTYEIRKPYMAAWRAAHQEQIPVSFRARIAAMSDEQRAKRAENARIRCINRRAQRKGNGGSHTAAEIRKLLTRQRCKCSSCSKSIALGYHIDHIIPLALGGSNAIGNIQLLCPSCNLRKAASHPIDWARKRGRLL